jgi:hypothetical protein
MTQPPSNKRFRSATETGGVQQAAIISFTFRRGGMIAAALEGISKLTADAFKGSPIDFLNAKP